jgi:hypothetical protein
MATRSRIGIQHQDGSVESIYCHFDGYPQNNGKILTEHYTDREMVEELISLGDISYLAPKVKPEGDDHTYMTPEKGVTVAYNRDRCDDYNKPRKDGSKGLYFMSDLEEYGYLFTKEGEWLIKGYSSGGPEPLSEVMSALKQKTS